MEYKFLWISSQVRCGQVFAGRVPFPGRTKVVGVYTMLRGRRLGRPDHPELSDRVWKTIKGCWKCNPAQRKTITEVVAILGAELNRTKKRVA